MEERYFLFIDGDYFKSYPSLESAKKDCWCGDKFKIYKAYLIETIINPKSESADV